MVFFFDNSWGRLPVDTGHGDILAEWSLVLIRLLPDFLAFLDVVWRVDGVVDADHDDQSPGEGDKDPVEIQRIRVVSLTAGEGIIHSHDGEMAQSEPREV